MDPDIGLMHSLILLAYVLGKDVLGIPEIFPILHSDSLFDTHFALDTQDYKLAFGRA